MLSVSLSVSDDTTMPTVPQDEHMVVCGDDGAKFSEDIIESADSENQENFNEQSCSASQAKLSKGQIIDLHKDKGLKETCRILKELSQATDKGIQYAIANCVKKFQNLKKSKFKKGGEMLITNFLKEEFELPKHRFTSKKAISKSGDNSGFMASVYKKVVHDVTGELRQLKGYSEQLEKTLQKHEKDIKKVSDLESRMKLHHEKMLNCKKETKEKVGVLTLELKEALQENKQLQLKNSTLEAKVSEKRKELKTTAAREKYANEKLFKFEHKFEMELETVEEMQTEMDENREVVETLKQRIRELEFENGNMNEIISEMSSKIVTTYDEYKKMFTPDLQCCVYSLLENHVGTSHVSSVIEAVLKMVGMEANRLPSRSSVNNMNIQRLIISQKQLSETLPDKINTCLYTDETSKKGEKYGGYHLSDSDGTMYVLGIRSLPTKSSADTLAAFHEILLDIDIAASTGNHEGRAILTHLKSTMSDRAATEVKFNKLLEDFRKEFLPAVISNYETLTELEKVSVDRLYNFFCGLHPLINMADTVDATLAEVEKECLQEPLSHSITADKSSTANFIRAASKIVARGADDKSGCYGQFKIFIGDFLTQNNMYSIPVEPYRGNCFNVIFSNAAGLFFIHKKLEEFLGFGDKANKLMSSVKADLQKPFLKASLKALGLICYIITAPLWCLLESKNVHILDINLKYLAFVNFLRDAALNIDAFMSGELYPFGKDTIISKDPIYHSLIADDPEIDPHVAVILSVLFPALHQLCQRLYKDHLPGGRYSSLASDMKHETKAVQKHNKFAEMVFGYLDFLLKFKPNVKTLAIEAYLLFSQNKTKDWLNGKTEREREEIVCEARKDVSDLRDKFKERQFEIMAKKRQILEEKQRKASKEQERKLKEKENLTNEIIKYGLFEIGEIDDKLLNCKTVVEKKKMLKLQLNYRQKVLKHPHEDPNIYKFSRKLESGKRKELSVDQLICNLKELIRT